MYTTDSLLLEILVEELPPKNLKKLGLSFASKIYTQLQKQGLLGQGATLTPFITPRRLALHITQVLPQSPEKTTKQKLLPASVGFDTYGQPTTPLLKKLKKLGLEGIALDKIQQCQDGKVSDMLFVIDTVPGTSIAFALQYLLDKTIPDLPIPKPMRYQVVDNTSHLRTVSFARPARGLLALYGSQILSVHTLGLRACDYTWGHRSMAIKNPIFISHADQYENMLEHDGSVIPHYDRRQQKISEQLSQQVAKSGNHLQVLHNDALLDEVTALVEYPHTYLCQFDKTFLKLPQECLVLTMQTHQRYFPLVDEKSKVTHQFLVVSNIAPKDPRHVIKGNERVVYPRLADARFFFDQDRKYPLLSRFSQLEKIVYHHQLGSQADRTKRVQKIVVVLIEHLIQTQNKQDNTISLRSVSVDQDQLLSLTDQAALLSKCDLTTCMVDEFPELQGTMGKYYAEYEGLPTEVSQAIEDHYKPRFAGDLLPHNPVTMLLAFADKLEILVGMFGIGHFPTGERDPFALRRHALGIIRILMETPLSIVLPVLLDKVSKIFGNLIKPEYITHNLSDFIYERLSGRLREEGFTTNQINAVLSLRPTDITQVVRRLEAIRIFTDMSQAPALIAANKRIVNILKKADKNGLKIDQSIIEPLLYEPAEQNLYKTLCQVAEQVQVTVNQQDYIHTFRVLANLETPIDHFFQEVMVNCEDSQLRTNRFALLHHLHQSMNQVADISRLID